MAQTIAIPGRRVSNDEVFTLDWIPRGGDCILLRIQILTAVAENGAEASFTLETRGEDGGSVTAISPTSPATGIIADDAGVFTCIYLATTSTTPGNGAQEQVRLQVAVSGGTPDEYFVMRIFPLIFFDSAKSYSV